MNDVDRDIERAIADLPDLIPRDKVAALIRVMVANLTPSVTASLSDARAFGRREALEDAALVCEQNRERWMQLGSMINGGPGEFWERAIGECVTRIRALAGKGDGI